METSGSTAQAAPGAGAAELVATLGQLLAVEVASCDRDALDVLVGRSQRLRGWLDAFDVKLSSSSPSASSSRARAAGRRLVVVDDGEVADDLVRDMVEVLTSLCARSYGRRSARHRALRALGCAQRDVGPPSRVEEAGWWRRWLSSSMAR